MRWGRFFGYLTENWRPFAVAVAAGIALATGTGAYLGDLAESLQPYATRPKIVAFGRAFLALLIALLLIVTPRAADYWQRYWRTHRLERPPAQYVDLVLAALGSFVVTYYVQYGATLKLPDVPSELQALAAQYAGVLVLWLFVCFAVADFPFPEGSGGKSRKAGKDGIYDDEPIQAEGENRLTGRIEFVEDLEKQIVRLPFPDSFVFGLNGSWGEGKTSVLNLLVRRLDATSRVIPIQFNPWYFANEAALIQGFYAALEDGLRKQYLLPGLHRLLRKYRSLLTLGLRPFGVNLSVPEDPERLRSALEEWVARTGCRLVIVIDDIDRLKPAEMLSVFRLTRLSTRINGTIFLLSFDAVIVRDALQHAGGIEPAFLEKIIQNPIQLPPAEQRDIDRFVLMSDPPAPGAHRSGIDSLLDELEVTDERRKKFDEKIVSFYLKHLRRLTRTLRQAKRLLNGIRATLPAVIDEVDLFDFVLLETLRIFYPRVHRDVWLNRWAYMPDWGLDESLSNPLPFMDENKRLEAVKQHITALLAKETQSDTALEILEEIFFVQVKNALGHGRTRHDGVAERYAAEKRLTHPRNFPKYFLYRVPTGELPDGEVERIIGRWNSLSGEATHEIDKDVRQYKEGGQLQALLEKISLFRAQVAAAAVPAIVRVLYRMVPELSREGGPWETEYAKAEGLVLRLIDERATPNDIRPLFEETMRNVAMPSFMVHMTLDCVRSEQSHDVRRIRDAISPATMREISAQRLSEHYVQGKRDIFSDSDRSEWGFVLFQWGTDWMTGSGRYRADVQQYVFNLVDKTPGHLGRLLQSFVDGGLRNDSPSFKLTEFSAIYEPKAVMDLLDRLGDTAFSSDEERQAAGLFRKAVDNRERSADDTKPPTEDK